MKSDCLEFVTRFLNPRVWILAVFACLLTGCSIQSTPEILTPLPVTGIEYASSPAPAQSEAAPRLVLQWWDDTTQPEAVLAIDNAINLYEVENPGIQIQRTYVPTHQLKGEILAASQERGPDIVLVDYADHQYLAAQGALADLTPLIQTWPDRSAYLESAWMSTLYQGGNYGIPFVTNTTALFYNLDMFALTGLVHPPATWDELRSYALALTQENHFGLCLATAPNEEGTFTFLSFLWQAGGDLATLGDDASLQTLDFLYTLSHIDRSTNLEPFSHAGLYDAFVTGRCAMMINGPWELPLFEADQVAFRWAVAPLPQGLQAAVILGGENFAVGSGANREAAWDVIRWMVSPEHSQPVLLALGLPARKDMLSDPIWAADPHRSVFTHQLAAARSRAYGPNYPQISEQVWIMIGRVLSGTHSIAQAAEVAGQAIRLLLEAK